MSAIPWQRWTETKDAWRVECPRCGLPLTLCKRRWRKLKDGQLTGLVTHTACGFSGELKLEGPE